MLIIDQPNDVLILIALKLEPCNLILWQQVCRRWHQLGHSEIVINATMVLKNPFIGDGQTWKDCFVFEQSLVSFYPGVEIYLDLYHCLARSIRSNHLPAVKYFLKRVTKDNLAESEFATLLDQSHDVNISKSLLASLSLCHPQTKKVDYRIKRAPLIERPYDQWFLPEYNLRAGYKFVLTGIKRKINEANELTYSREIRFLCRQLPQ